MKSVPRSTSLCLFDGKICRACGEWKPFSEFREKKCYADKLHVLCRPCDRTDARDYARRNAQKQSEYQRNRRAANPERVHAIEAASRQRRKPWASSKKRSYQKQYHESYRVMNHDRIRQNQNRWNHLNWDRYMANQLAGKHARRARLQQNGGSYTFKEWRELCDKYGNACLCCGKKSLLTVDHVKPIILGGSNFIDNLQPLCITCNLKKGKKEIDYRP